MRSYRIRGSVLVSRRVGVNWLFLFLFLIGGDSQYAVNREGRSLSFLGYILYAVLASTYIDE